MKLDSWIYFENSDIAINLNSFSVMTFVHENLLTFVRNDGACIDIIDAEDIRNFRKNVLKVS